MCSSSHLQKKGSNAFFALQEDTYVEFLKLRGVPLTERECPTDTEDVVPQVRLFLYKYHLGTLGFI
jgi:hypothetical protein